ncbi:MAG TPA: alpha/beta hydrolase-fold protein, partial [Gemmatimonadaceae bacterium]|nr:alpha/beta hydrolase-fold protein [Gemmatimonadaceae bacterium]
ASRTITIGSIDSIWSPILKEQRRYEVYTPPGYQQSPYAPRAYPVLYLLDGDAHFHSVTGILQILGTGVNATYVVPEMIVIAIPNTDRTRDLTPTRAGGPDGKPLPGRNTSGGMSNFLQFLKAELIPHVDSTYRTEPYRVFVGHSLGGITTINAMYTMPETFNAYVAIDPSLWWDNQLLLKKSKEYFGKPALPGRALFVGQANTKSETDTATNIHFNSIVEFNRTLESNNTSGIRYAYKYYDGDDHGSVPLIAEYDALRFIFAGYKVDLQKSLARPALIAEHFADVSSTLGYKVLPPEKMVDQLGQISLGTDTTKAVAFMQLNADLYPKSSHAFVSLGTALLAKRDTIRARAAYERSLALAPGNKVVQDALQALGRKK